MIYIITLLLVVVCVLLWLILKRMAQLMDFQLQTAHEVRELRLTSRARVSKASMQSGEVSHEQKLVRLGRASTGRRIVVGGDDDSQLNKNLSTTTNPAMVDNE